MDRLGAVRRARNRLGPPRDHRRPERARPGHHVYGDVAPRSHGGHAPRLKRRQPGTMRGSTSCPRCFCPISLCLSHQGRYPPCAVVAEGACPHLPAPGAGAPPALAYARAWHAPCILLSKYTLCGGQTMRYEVTTTLSPQAAIAYAKNYFGPQGVGLNVVDEHETSVTLTGGGGHVSVVACSAEKKTILELETREWDYPVRQFMP